MKNDYGGPERRRFRRVRADFTLIYRIDRPIEVRIMIGSRDIDSVMLDLSEGGMSILTDYNIPVSTVLIIKFTLINMKAEKERRTRVMSIIGEVRYNRSLEGMGRRLGICFIEIDEADRSAIVDFVKMIASS
ncbi:MAG: PilZ domain-containing protein [Candidatus Omnitrophota bacterium]|nr:MAG: PilZ domain-containing protein [Candidatus Omnitrophota bacterium]